MTSILGRALQAAESYYVTLGKDEIHAAKKEARGALSLIKAIDLAPDEYIALGNSEGDTGLLLSRRWDRP